jgi:hypothetical protein
MQTTIDLGEPRQNGITFPMSLTEKYQPRTINVSAVSEARR